MIVIVAGSRSLCTTPSPGPPNILQRNALTAEAVEFVLDAIVESGYVVTVVISGCAVGPDTAALLKPWACPVIKIKPQWQRDGRAAGFIRNQAMIDQGAHALVAIWDGVSNGTRDMITKARKAGLDVFVKLFSMAA